MAWLPSQIKQNPPLAQLPPGKPFKRQGTANTTIAVFQEFFGMSKSTLIRNRDGVNNLTFRWMETDPFTTIGPNSSFTIDNQWLTFLRIETSTNWEVIFEIVEYHELKKYGIL